MIVSEREAARLGQTENLNAAKRALMRGENNASVHAKHGWYVDQNGLMKRVLSNQGSKITVPRKNRVVPLNSVFHHPAFFRAVPGAANWTASVRDLPGSTQGIAMSGRKHIAISPKIAQGTSTWRHEIQHIAQHEQRAPWNSRGTNPRAAGGFQNYRNNHGEVEARAAGANAPMSAKAQALMRRATARGVTRPAIRPPKSVTRPRMMPKAPTAGITKGQAAPTKKRTIPTARMAG